MTYVLWIMEKNEEDQLTSAYTLDVWFEVWNKLTARQAQRVLLVLHGE